MQGLAYPLSLSRNGLTLETSYAGLVRNAILSVLSTYQEERVYRPEYGVGRYEFMTYSNLPELLAELRLAIELGLEGYPEVTFGVSGYLSEENVEISVNFQCPDSDPQELNVAI